MIIPPKGKDKIVKVLQPQGQRVLKASPLFSTIREYWGQVKTVIARFDTVKKFLQSVRYCTNSQVVQKSGVTRTEKIKITRAKSR